MSSVQSSDLAGKLCRLTLVRGVVALALGAYALSLPTVTPAVVTRLASVYWIVDALAAGWISRFAATVATTRVVLIIRAAAGLAAALVLLALPLAEVFGPWRPGQLMFLIFTAIPALASIGLQIVLAATIDLVVGFEARRRIPGEWSIILAAGVSIGLGVAVAACFFDLSRVPGQLVGVIGVAGGLGLIAAALRLRRGS